MGTDRLLIGFLKKNQIRPDRNILLYFPGSCIKYFNTLQDSFYPVISCGVGGHLIIRPKLVDRSHCFPGVFYHLHFFFLQNDINGLIGLMIQVLHWLGGRKIVQYPVITKPEGLVQWQVNTLRLIPESIPVFPSLYL